MKWIINGVEYGEHFDSPAEFDAFYESIKKGALPTTVALNPEELQSHFETMLKNNPEGDIIHIPLSSGLSVTCDSAFKAAEVVNRNLKDRKVYVVDSLIATHGMGWLVDELIDMRNKGVSTQDAIKRTENLRDHMHLWVAVNDLFHLKRGGRVSGAKAAIGTMLNLKPIIIVNSKGKLAIESKAKGMTMAIEYLLKKMHQYGEKANPNFAKGTVYIARTTEDKSYEQLKSAITKKYPAMTIKEGRVGPVIGSHLGSGAILVFFEGAPRLTIN